jgi:hypothetical protein
MPTVTATELVVRSSSWPRYWRNLRWVGHRALRVEFADARNHGVQQQEHEIAYTTHLLKRGDPAQRGACLR